MSSGMIKLSDKAVSILNSYWLTVPKMEEKSKLPGKAINESALLFDPFDWDEIPFSTRISSLYNEGACETVDGSFIRCSAMMKDGEVVLMNIVTMPKYRVFKDDDEEKQILSDVKDNVYGSNHGYFYFYSDNEDVMDDDISLIHLTYLGKEDKLRVAKGWPYKENAYDVVLDVVVKMLEQAPIPKSKENTTRTNTVRACGDKVYMVDTKFYDTETPAPSLIGDKSRNMFIGKFELFPFSLSAEAVLVYTFCVDKSNKGKCGYGVTPFETNMLSDYNVPEYECHEDCWDAITVSVLE